MAGSRRAQPAGSVAKNATVKTQRWRGSFIVARACESECERLPAARFGNVVKL
jgi:hypothetical protein